MSESTAGASFSASAEELKRLYERTDSRWLAGVFLQLTAGFAAIFTVAQANFLLAHVFAELFSVAVAWTVFFIVWNGRRYFENGFFLLLGISYLFIGIVDVTHSVAYKGMNVFPWADTDLPTQLWIVARYMEGAAFLAAPFMLGRKVRPTAAIVIIGLATTLLMTLIFTRYFPACHIEGVGLTPFKKWSEYVISAGLLVAGLLLFRRRNYFSIEVFLYLLGAIFMTILSELFFTFYIGVYDLSNLLGHYFKFVSFYLLYKGVVVRGIREPYSFLAQHLRRRNEELEASREELRSTQIITSTMLDSLPEEISLLDLESYRIVDANRAFIESHGPSRENVIGKTCYEVTHEFGGVCGTCSHPCPLMEEGPLKFGEPVVHIHKDLNGKEHYVEISVRKVRDDRTGSATGHVVHIARDVTDRMRAEQLREDVERVVRHDLKSPLNGIIGGAQLLDDSPNLTEEERQLVKAVYESGNSVLQMVNQSLDMYRMAEGSYELSPSIFDLENMLRRIEVRFQKEQRARDVSLRIVIDGRMHHEVSPFMMRGEEHTIENLLSNLVQNAFDASPSGEAVTIRIERRDGEILFDIHNRGMIPEEIRDRFFERYVTAGKRRGTGLGTYSAWLMARAHGGTVSFSTDEEEGTHLYVHLPDRPVESSMGTESSTD